jgi:hypothetical protein
MKRLFSHNFIQTEFNYYIQEAYLLLMQYDNRFTKKSR